MRGTLGRVMAKSALCDSQHHSFQGKWLGARRKLHKGGVKNRCFLLYPINTRGLWAGSRQGEGSAFCQRLKAQNFGMFSTPSIKMIGHTRLSFYPCEKMLCPNCFGQNTQKENTNLTTIPVFRGKTHTKCIITHDQLGWKFQFLWNNVVCLNFRIKKLIRSFFFSP